MDPKNLTKKYIWKTRVFFCNVCHSTKVMPSTAYSEDVLVMHPCGHRFCGSCVTDIIYGSKTQCPSCQKDIDKYVWYTGRGRGKGKNRMKEQWSVNLKQFIADQKFAASVERLRNQRARVDELEETVYCMTVSSANETEESMDSLLTFRQMRKIDFDNIKNGIGVTASFLQNEAIILTSTTRKPTSYAQGMMLSDVLNPMTGPMLTMKAPLVTEPSYNFFDYLNNGFFRLGKMKEDSITHETVNLEFECKDDDDDEIPALE